MNMTQSEGFYYLLGSRPGKWLLMESRPGEGNILAQYKGRMFPHLVGGILETLKAIGFEVDLPDKPNKRQEFIIETGEVQGSRITLVLIGTGYIEFTMEELT